MATTPASDDRCHRDEPEAEAFLAGEGGRRLAHPEDPADRPDPGEDEP